MGVLRALKKSPESHAQHAAAEGRGFRCSDAYSLSSRFGLPGNRARRSETAATDGRRQTARRACPLPGSPRREPRECGTVSGAATRIPSACASGFPATGRDGRRPPLQRADGRRHDGHAICREARGASRGNVERFPVQQRVFPQLALRASRQPGTTVRDRRYGRPPRHAAAESRAAGSQTEHPGTQRPKAAPRAPRNAAGPTVSGGPRSFAHHQAAWRAAAASPGTPWLCPRLAEAAGAMDGPAAGKFRTARSRRSRRRTGRTGRCSARRAAASRPGPASTSRTAVPDG